MVISYAFANFRTGRPGLGMVPTCSTTVDACSIPLKSSVVERPCGHGCSYSGLISSSSGVSFVLFAPSVWKMLPLGGIANEIRGSTNISTLPFGLVRLPHNVERRRANHACVGALEIGMAQTIEEQKTEVKNGSKVKVKGPLKVYHIPKVPEFDLSGLEGEVKDVLREWKGKPISANLPYKVQFLAEIDGKQVKFVAHLKEGEFEVVK